MTSDEPRRDKPTRSDGARPLSDRLWAEITPIYDRILAHPFLAGLTSGDLDPARFRHYVRQDVHYLRTYARVLDDVADRAPDPTIAAMFRQHAANAAAVEHDLHAGLLAGLDSGPEPGAEPDGVGATTLAYTSYLLATVHTGSFAEGLGAVLPCYWIYWEVGKTLLARSSPHPLYARWIATYGGDDFGRVVADVVALTDRIGETLTAEQQERVRDRFVTASRYEWMFWDAAYRLESWPV